MRLDKVLGVYGLGVLALGLTAVGFLWVPALAQDPGVPPGAAPVVPQPTPPAGVSRAPTPMRSSGTVTPVAVPAASPAAKEKEPKEPAGEGGSKGGPPRLRLENATLDFVLQDFAEKTGRTMLMDQGLPQVNITLRSQSNLTMEEYLMAVETVLNMHGIAMLKVGDKFLKVVPVAKARQEAMGITPQAFKPIVDEVTKQPVTNETGRVVTQRVPLDENGQLISQLVELKYIEIAEARAAIEPLKHPYAQVHSFDQRNSLLITDTADNVNRMAQVLEYIDVKPDAREQQFVIQIHHAKASDIKGKLREIIDEFQRDQQQKESTVPKPKKSGSPGVETAAQPAQPTEKAPPGVIRAPKSDKPQETTEEMEEVLQLAERGIIRGKVHIVADDRTNILIIITRPENMTVLERIITVLDVATAPDVMVKVFRLEFADAKSVASMLNELIGAATREEPKPPTAAGGTPTPNAPSGKSEALTDYAQRMQKPADSAVVSAAARKSKMGELSKDDIKILAEERTNSLVIMASKGDLATLQEIIKDMDMMLSQVLIEAVVLAVDLNNDLQTGVEWLQRAMLAYNQNPDGSKEPVMAFAGQGGGGVFSPQDVSGGISMSPSAGLTYYLTMFDLNLDAVVRLAATDSRTRVISAPVILTTDNKEATLSATDQIYVFKSYTYVNDNATPQAEYEVRDVGLTLSVKPHINENKIVMMEIKQTTGSPGDGELKSGGKVSSTQNLEASIAVRSGQTIVLGGRIRESTTNSKEGIPLLMNIPILGRLFGFTQDTGNRTESIVLITPHVLDSDMDIEAETRRRTDSMAMGGAWKRGWSNSRLAEPNPKMPKPVPTSDGNGVGLIRRDGSTDSGTVVPGESAVSGNGAGKVDPELSRFIEMQERRLKKPAAAGNEPVAEAPTEVPVK